ncbi:KIAA0141 [Cervus elaphus hippelaphus]|uniref:DAP3-binding cell death enhancer 1 n=1 Tax=Cervus elaphus hippelaphus TaxID=46360 RepID=A0A212D0Y9_CEREH|nr:KIAA0141 [Cervus elaphus hippelaphus]
MWRLPGLLGRALPRLLGPGFPGVTPKSSSPDGPQATSSNLLVPVPSFDRSSPHCPGPGTSRGPKSHGWKDAFQWMSAHGSRNTLWDAISWLARQIHFQTSLPAGPWRVEHCSWYSPLDRFLSSPLRHPCSYPSDISFLHASSSFKSKPKPAQPQPTDEKQEQEKSKLSLEEAVTSIQQLFQLSVSIAFNFLGTENMKNGDYMAAFSYFQKAADRGYSKAQYNVGLCHEHGRGTPRDPSKAAFYYQLAASQGHNLAQYRYARCLLQDPGSSWDHERQRAVSMLKRAADSGLREAQAFLGVLFTKEPYVDEQRAVKYLWLAANNGDSQSRYHLGICYEKGLGVQRSLGEAMRCYQQSAALGNTPAQERLRALFSTEAAGTDENHSHQVPP